jgi:hypothetical protein
MRWFAFVLIGWLAVSTARAEELHLPFEGRWFVAQGGDTLNVNHHMASVPQRFGVDFVKVGGASGREVSRPNPSRLEDFYGWAAPVFAPVDAKVLAVDDDLPDNPLGIKDGSRPAGNHVSLEIGDGRYLFLAHFQRGSIVVRPGERVVRGQFLGRCGNSGNSDLPHIHMHLQNQSAFGAGQGQMPVFTGMNVELSGQVFEDVTWPVIRGLFVWPR